MKRPLLSFLLLFALVLPSHANGASSSALRKLKLSAATVTFKDVTLGGKKSYSFWLSNRGNKAVTVKKVSFSGTDRKAFKTSWKGRRTIPRKRRVKITVSFSPQHVGGSQGLLVIATSAGKLTATLNGTATDGTAAKVISITPDTGGVGTIVSVTGWGFGNSTADVEVIFNGYSTTVLSVTPTLILAQIPEVPAPGWDGRRMGEIWARKKGAVLPASDVFYFTVTGLPPIAPIVYNPGDLRNNASIGDTVSIFGQGFAASPELNLVSFNGAVTTALTYAPDTSREEGGVITVVVPEGASTGPVSFRRQDGYPGDWSEGFTFTVRPPGQLVLAAGFEASGLINPYPEGQDELEELAFSGSGFSKLWASHYEPHWLMAEFVTSAGSHEQLCIVVSDTKLTCSLVAETWSKLGLVSNAAVRVRVRGEEPTNFQIRYSNWLDLRVRTQAIPGALWTISLGHTYQTWERPLRFPKGDLITLRGYYFNKGVLNLTAPCLWSGVLSLPSDGLINWEKYKTFLASTKGECNLTETGTGWSVPIEIVEDGRSGGAQRTFSAKDGLVIGFGGGRLEIPAGALPAGTYKVTAKLEEESHASEDPEQTDGGRSFSVIFDPEPSVLLKPISMKLPYSSTGRATVPRFGLWDDEAGCFLPLQGAAVDENAKTVTFALPAGAYPPAASSSPSRAMQAAAATAPPVSPVPEVTLNQITGNMAVIANSHDDGVIEDSQHRLFVDYITDPSSTSYVTKIFAESVLSLAIATYENLENSGWTPPSKQVTLYIRQLGAANAIQGYTTSGVFGNPWVYINSSLSTFGDDRLTHTGIGHEVAHLFQRQLTTNLNVTGASWLDEASADWAAFDTFGSNNFSVTNMQAGLDFPTITFPSSFAGFSREQNYAVGAFGIWVENECVGCPYGSLLEMYNALNWSPSYWYDSRATIAAGTGRDFPSLLRDFALDYWRQTFEPVKNLSLEPLANQRHYTTWDGIVINEARPAYSSKRYSLDLSASALSGIGDHYGVARVTDTGTGACKSLGANQEIHIYGDSNLINAIPGTLQELAVLKNDKTCLKLGTSTLGTYKSFRIVTVNFSDTSVTPNLSFVAPHVVSLTPSTQRRDYKGSVTVAGKGFGKEQGSVKVGGIPVEVSDWRDDRVIIIMPMLPAPPGPWEVAVVTAEDVESNAGIFQATGIPGVD